MKPEIMNYLSLSLSIFLFLFYLHPVTSICVPRTDYITLQQSNHTASVSVSNSSLFSVKLHSVPAANPAASANGDILKSLAELCGKTEYKDVCISSVESVLPSSGSLDAATLLRLQLDVIKAKYQAARVKVMKLLDDPETNEHTKMMLEVCHENYDAAMDNIQDARKALQAQDGATLGVNLSALGDQAYTCEGAFDESNATSPTKMEDTELQQIGSVVVTMGTLAVPSGGDQP